MQRERPIEFVAHSLGGIEGRRTGWKDIWKNMETGRIFGPCDHLSSCLTWRCLETSRILSLRSVSAQYLMYIRTLGSFSW